MVRRKKTPRHSDALQKVTPSISQTSPSTSRPSTSDTSHRRKSKTPKKANNLPMRMGHKTFTMSRRMLKEIRRLQMTTKLVMPRSPFIRVVREILLSTGVTDLRIQGVALEALQEAAELYLVQLFEDSYLLTAHASRATLMVRDMQMVRRLRGRGDVINH